jgi:hypothetical protein
VSPPISEAPFPLASDLTSTAPLGFGVDSDMGKKLSLDMATFMAGNVTFGGNSAYIFYRNGTLVWSVCTSVSTLGFFYEIRKNNVAVNFGGSTDIATEVVYTMDIDFSIGDLLQFYWSNTNGVGSLTETPVVNFGIRWRQ